MNTKSKFNEITNFDDVEGKYVSRILNNDDQQDAFDRMKSFFDEVRASHQKIEKDEFYAFTLYSRKMTLTEFVSYYPAESPFFKETINEKGSISVNESATVVEARIHIPEISGMLPLPDWSIYAKRRQLLTKRATSQEKGSNPKDAEDVEKELKQATEDWYKEILKISLFPKAYYYTEKGENLDWGRFCKVKFSKSMPTKGVGIITQKLDDGVKK